MFAQLEAAVVNFHTLHGAEMCRYVISEVVNKIELLVQFYGLPCIPDTIVYQA